MEIGQTIDFTRDSNASSSQRGLSVTALDDGGLLSLAKFILGENNYLKTYEDKKCMLQGHEVNFHVKLIYLFCSSIEEGKHPG